jgi:hypothetical protein
VSFGVGEGEASRWLRGGPVRQRDIRQRIERDDPQLATSMRKVHDLLSDEIHGRAQSLAVYENRRGEFDWPPHAADVGPVRIRAAYATTLALLLAHFGALRWLIRTWAVLSSDLSPHVAAYYDALVEFVLAHQDHGDWRVIAPGHAAAWLGIPEAGN